MRFFKKIFQKKKQHEGPPVPARTDIVEMMYDKGLDSFAKEPVNVIYSADKTMRYVVLKDENGLFTYLLEALYFFDSDEWQYIRAQKDAAPAMWEPFRGAVGKSLFENEKELLQEMKREPEYKRYFE